MSAPNLEGEVGINGYASGSAPCHAVAKETPEDFRVEEKISLGEVVAEERAGYYPLYRVEKRSVDTMHLEKELSRALKSRLAFGGLKDKKAVAVQYLTPTSMRSERPKVIEGKQFVANLVGFAPRPMSVGAVVGNKFEIRLRRCCSSVESSVKEVFRLGAERRLPNFFGSQRFGRGTPGTHRVGKSLVKRDFEEAVLLMVASRRENDDERVLRARDSMAQGNFEAGWRVLPRGEDVEALVARHLSRKPADWVGALREVPVRLRRLFVQAYQSYIFNKTLSEAMAAHEDFSAALPGDNWSGLVPGNLMLTQVHGVRETPQLGAVPMVQIPGFAYRNYGSRFDKYLAQVMEEEGVTGREFYVEEMQEVSSEGGFRVPHMLMADPSCEFGGDEALLKFTLARGQYATILLREVLKT